MKYAVSSIQRGFTLVELLIVVIILALLAAIVVPQFSSSTEDAKAASLNSTLANVRAAIDLYYQQHGEYPSAIAATGGAACVNGTAGTGAIDTEAAFLQQLSYYTDANGAACTQKNGTSFTFGPYLKKTLLPSNPISTISALLVVTDGDLNLTGSAANLGWRFDNVSGRFIANDTSNDPSGNPWDSH